MVDIARSEKTDGREDGLLKVRYANRTRPGPSVVSSDIGLAKSEARREGPNESSSALQFWEMMQERDVRPARDD